MKFFIPFLTALTLFAMGDVTSASFITGDISIVALAGWQPVGGTGIADATGVDIVNEAGLVTVATDDFAADALSAVTFNDFSLTVPPAIDPLWGPTVNGFSFKLETLSISSQTSSGIVVTGTGTITGGAFTPTPGVWSWSGDRNAAGVFNWSSTTSAVPEPGTIAIWSILSVLGAVLAVRSRRS